MIDGLISLVVSIVEFVASMFAAIVEFVASFFVGAGETLGAMDVFIVLFVVLVELLVWMLLWVKELVFSLLGRRKPKVVPKPLYWRPKARPKDAKN